MLEFPLYVWLSGVPAAVARYFQWHCPSPKIQQHQILGLMIHYCDVSAEEEHRPQAVNMWAHEFYRSLAIVAREALYPT
ncbi:hypothetical protein C8R43DRAFT_1125075 [Mycena crocata]|nr:hypothetical protein C8R43DRAFT_1125075 [Mycena crocata]